MSKRVLLAGLFHETHTFLEGTTGLSDFQIAHGEELLARKGDASPMGGLLEAADKHGWTILPTVDFRATPGAIVEDDLFLLATEVEGGAQFLVEGVRQTQRLLVVSRSSAR